MEYHELESRLRGAIRENLSPDEFAELALKVFRFQRERNSPYRAYCERQDIPPTLDDWTQIPAVPQTIFKRYELRSFPVGETNAIFHTSGTTGEGYGRHFFHSLSLYRAAALAGFRALGLPRLRQISLIAPPAEAPHSSLSRMMEFLAEETETRIEVMTARGLDLPALEAAVTASGEPVLLLGTALAFLHWVQAIEASGRTIVLPPGSVIFETGGYKGSGETFTRAQIYARLEASLHVPARSIVNEYGMTETSSQFYAWGDGEPHAGGPWVRARIVDPESGREAAIGETGLIQVYDLANLGSVLAVETRDLAVRREKGFQLAGRDPAALPRGCSRPAGELLAKSNP